MLDINLKGAISVKIYCFTTLVLGTLNLEVYIYKYKERQIMYIELFIVLYFFLN